MYEIPGAEDISAVTINGEVIEGKAKAELAQESSGKKAKKG